MAVQEPESPVPSPTSTNWNHGFAKTAESLRPTLSHWNRPALGTIQFEPDEDAYFGVRKTLVTDIEGFERQQWGSGEEFIMDFGIHMVGYLSMHLESHLAHMDAPCRLRLTFGESPLDVTLGMNDVKTWISTSWLPDEVVNVDTLPTTLSIPRRHAFRYLRVEVLATSPKYKVSFSNINCDCVSAVAQEQDIEAPRFSCETLRTIDKISIFTLRDCMQEVFEDGPRRDRRLWLGDLRLQALANYATFKDFGLVKRCILQFAAVARQDGSIPACIFDAPHLRPSTDYIVDYDAMFAVVVDDYVKASGDLSTGEELYSTVLNCLKRPMSHLRPEDHVFDASMAPGFKFLDWQTDLHRDAGCHGLLLYCLKAANNLATMLNKPWPFEAKVLKMTDGAKHFLDKDGNIVSGPKQQKSYASAAWLALSGALAPEVSRKALLGVLSDPAAVRPLTPYLWHYVCDALAAVGCYDECVRLVKEYWGGMLRAGADTFWEAFDPEDARASPYGDVRNNSFCHAWSCTPAYLLRVRLAEHVMGGRGDACVKTTLRELDESWLDLSLKSDENDDDDDEDETERKCDCQRESKAEAAEASLDEWRKLLGALNEALEFGERTATNA